METAFKREITFNSGISEADFTRARMTGLVGEPGFVVAVEGKVSVWRAQGTCLEGGCMAVEGPWPFREGPEGRRMDELLRAGGETGLAALKAWLTARLRLRGAYASTGADAEAGAGTEASALPVSAFPAPNPLGAWVCPEGVFFAPEKLVQFVRRRDEAFWYEAAEAWHHPDLDATGRAEASDAWTGAAMLYALLSGEAPFKLCALVALSPRQRKDPNNRINILHSDQREGVFTPLRYAAPGVEKDVENMVGFILGPSGKTDAKKPGLAELYHLVQSKASIDSFFQKLSNDDRAKILEEKRRWLKRRERIVKGRRFAVRNRTILAVAAGVVVLGCIIAYSTVRNIRSRPNTLGLQPEQVVSGWYQALGSLNTNILDDYSTGKAGGDFKNAVSYLWVTSRYRMAIEGKNFYETPDEWLKAGAKPTDALVFGVKNLSMNPLDADPRDGTLSFMVNYTLYYPNIGSNPDEGQKNETASPPPKKLPLVRQSRDEVSLGWFRDRWRITEIKHLAGGLGK
jgi:hypothetical protein